LSSGHEYRVKPISYVNMIYLTWLTIPMTEDPGHKEEKESATL